MPDLRRECVPQQPRGHSSQPDTLAKRAPRNTNIKTLAGRGHRKCTTHRTVCSGAGKGGAHWPNPPTGCSWREVFLERGGALLYGLPIVVVAVAEWRPQTCAAHKAKDRYSPALWASIFPRVFTHADVLREHPPCVRQTRPTGRRTMSGSSSGPLFPGTLSWVLGSCELGVCLKTTKHKPSRH